MSFWKGIKADQSGSKIGINRVDNLSINSIAGKVVNHSSGDDDDDDDASKSAGSRQSIGVAFSKNVWVNGKRIS